MCTPQTMIKIITLYQVSTAKSYILHVLVSNVDMLCYNRMSCLIVAFVQFIYSHFVDVFNPNDIQVSYKTSRKKLSQGKETNSYKAVVTHSHVHCDNSQKGCTELSPKGHLIPS